MPYKLKLILIFTLLLSSLHAIADNHAAPELDAKFVTEQCTKPCKKAVKNDWWLMRDKNQVELRTFHHKNALDEHGEIWRFNPADGQMQYLFLMHDEKRVIEYLHEDLNLLQMSPGEQKWQEVSELISEQDLATLKKSAKKSKGYFGKPSEIYTGNLNGAKVNIIWIPELHIPYQIRYDYPKTSVKITLKSVNAGLQNEQAPRSTQSLLNSYSQVYYTDIGDMEQNPEDKTWIKKAHGAPGLGTHHHNH